MNFFNLIRDKKMLMTAISVFINIFLIIFTIYNFFIRQDVANDKNIIAINDDVDIKEENENNFFVEIKGAVKFPGVYSVTSANIINDLVKMAGGFNKNAYTKNINLSKKLTSELVIYVYTNNEYKKIDKLKTIINTKIVEKECECSSYDISNCTNNLKSEIVSSEKDSIYNENENTSVDNKNNNLVNINTASKDDLTKLSGVGESKAIAIIEYRSKNGNFKSIEEILNVTGIGNSIYEKIKDNITV